MIFDKHLQFWLVRVSIELNLILTCLSCSKFWSTGLGRDSLEPRIQTMRIVKQIVIIYMMLNYFYFENFCYLCEILKLMSMQKIIWAFYTRKN